MRNHIVFKFLAIVLASVALLGTVASAGCLFMLAVLGIGSGKTVEEYYAQEQLTRCNTLAASLARRYASQTLGGIPEEALDTLFTDRDALLDKYGCEAYQINALNGSGSEIYGEASEDALEITIEVGTEYAIAVPEAELAPSTAEATEAAATEAESAWAISISLNNGGTVTLSSFSGEKTEITAEAYTLGDEQFAEIEEYISKLMDSYGIENLCGFACVELTLTEPLSEAAVTLTFPEGYVNAADNALCHVLVEQDGVVSDMEAGYSITDDSLIDVDFSLYSMGQNVRLYVITSLDSGDTAASTVYTVYEDGREYVSEAEEATAAAEGEVEQEFAGEDAAIETTPAELPTEKLYYTDADGSSAVLYYTWNYYSASDYEYVDYAVTMYITAGTQYLELPDEPQWNLLQQIYDAQTEITVALGICIAVLAVLSVYLCCAAGHKPGTQELRPAGLNRLPLDLYALIMAAGIFWYVILLAYSFSNLTDYQVMPSFGMIGYCGLACSALIIGFFYALAAQVKLPGGYWWRSCLCGRVIRLAWRLLRWAWRLAVQFVRWAWRLAVQFVRWAWTLLGKVLRRVYGSVGRVCGAIGRTFTRFYGRLPYIWQWLLAIGAIMLLSNVRFGYDYILWLLCRGLAVVIGVYLAYSFGTLLKSVKRMRAGDLSAKVDIARMVGSFREFGEALNGLSDVVKAAAKEQMKSERMRTELITNVSHDIKTPLTSIINYVELLKLPHDEQQNEEYLEVLSRQSARMRRLIEDLIELSKAASGNLPVNITEVDAGEAVQQALGEFSDRLEAAGLTPVFRRPAQSVPMLADGRLVWRSLSNLLSNAVKYAMPGTRFYIDLTQAGGSVLISMKNISREELNVSADELMERFVRGDASRNTEGSGLGLNIVKTVMELQGGSLTLLVDGDLFKATLCFPSAGA